MQMQPSASEPDSENSPVVVGCETLGERLEATAKVPTIKVKDAIVGTSNDKARSSVA